MARSSGYAELAGSLATVAIALLAGPLPAFQAALSEVVKQAQTRLDTSAPTRDLRRQVSAEVTAWAGGEGLDRGQVELGLAEATRAVARFGLSQQAIADLHFDEAATGRSVLTAAKAGDPYWGTESHYAVAERAITRTYRVVVQQLRDSGDGVFPAIQSLRAAVDESVARAEAMTRRVERTLTELMAGLVAAGTVAEVMAYLRFRIADWDVSVWPGDRPAPAALERRLTVRVGGGASASRALNEGAMKADEALAGPRMLVVLGGPGSGKTWLARRYARKAAQAALSRLENGADLEEVELPLLTTWDQWGKTPGGPRQSLVAASFASGLGYSDPWPGDTADRLHRLFLRPDTKVLLLVDSLDEAADHARQAARLRELTSLNGWRVVVTSRPAAWHATYPGVRDATDGSRVVELKDLDYPSDVEAFVRSWFAANPGRGEGLIDQLRARPDLARVAVIPLMLTFYCLLADDPSAAGQPLPARRRQLYGRLVRRLLQGEWTSARPGLDTEVDPDSCERLLTEWAWAAVRDRSTPTGLGDWGDTFHAPPIPRGFTDHERRAIDHVAPKVGWDAEGGITRRFVHRTVLEHFVAENIAVLDAHEATRVLLPHLWFDADWKATAPAAIAAHNQRGVILDQLLDQTAVHGETDAARQAVDGEFERLLMAIAEESGPDDWPPKQRDLLHDCRVRRAVDQPATVARSAHWDASNARARTALLAALPTADPGAVGALVAALPALDLDDAERAEARTALLAALPTADPFDVLALVEALPALDPDDAERAEARTAVLAALATADPFDVRALVAALPALVTGDAERAEARTALLAALPTADPFDVLDLVAALRTVSPVESWLTWLATNE